MVVNAGKAAVVGSKCSPRRGSSPHVRKADRTVDAQPWSIVVRVSFAYADRGPEAKRAARGSCANSLSPPNPRADEDRAGTLSLGKRRHDCGSLADLTGGPFQTLRTNGRTPREPLLNNRAKGVLQAGTMPCVCCAHARPRPADHPSLPRYHRLGRARSG
jgi:hypothetical protein